MWKLSGKDIHPLFMLKTVENEGRTITLLQNMNKFKYFLLKERSMGKTLSEQEAELFLEKQRFPIVDRELVKTSKQALEAAKDIGYPVAMKVYSPQILHKSDVGGVQLDIRNEKEVEYIFKKIYQNHKTIDVLINNVGNFIYKKFSVNMKKLKVLGACVAHLSFF